MHRIKADVQKNRIYITLSGNLDKIEGEQIIKELARAVGNVKKGFDVINNISRFNRSGPGAADLLPRAMEFLKDAGVGRIVRVIGGSKNALLLFAQKSKGVQDYTIKYAPTIAAAEEELRKKW